MGGELIGITTAEMVGGQNLNFAVPINVVKPLLSGSSPRKLADKPNVKETCAWRIVISPATGHVTRFRRLDEPRG